jgi:hypothetical protein
MSRLLYCSPCCEEAEPDCKAPCKTCKLKVVYRDWLYDEVVGKKGFHDVLDDGNK